MRFIYLGAAVIGAVSTWTYNILQIQQTGGFSASEFVMQGFQGTAILGSMAADFWVGATISMVWMLVEARRLKMPYWWAFLPLSICIAWAFALPLFLYFRERALDEPHPS